MNYFLAFIAMVLLNFVYALYTRKVAEGKELSASALSVVIFALHASVIAGFVEDNTLFLPASLGAFLGTFLAIRWDRENKKKKLRYGRGVG